MIASGTVGAPRSREPIARAANRPACWACSISDGGSADGEGVLEPFGGLLVGERQPLVGLVAAGTAVGFEGEVAAVKAAGGGGVDRRDQLLGDVEGVTRAGWEEMQDVGGDREADQPWDRGRQERDRPLGGLLAGG